MLDDTIMQISKLKPTVTVTIGLPASGKSQWAKEQLCANIKRVNKDDLRSMTDNGAWSSKNEKFIIKLRNAIILEAVNNNFDIIVDDTNLDPNHLANIRALVGDKANVIIKDFTDVPLDVCLQRDYMREGKARVGADVINGMYAKYLKKPVPVLKQNVNLPTAMIVDIDGTLAKMNGRRPFEWHRVREDLVNEAVADLVKDTQDFHSTIILSGRDSVCRAETEKWLRDNNIPYNELYMRAEGDNRKDSIIKEELYHKYIENKYYVRLILDDRDSVVSLWRSLGLSCFQVAPGNF